MRMAGKRSRKVADPVGQQLVRRDVFRPESCAQEEGDVETRSGPHFQQAGGGNIVQLVFDDLLVNAFTLLYEML